jgi:cystathionine beta-lyase/cystathionine gamma-synthase
MAAISATLLALCKVGDHIVASNTVYGAYWPHCVSVSFFRPSFAALYSCPVQSVVDVCLSQSCFPRLVERYCFAVAAALSIEQALGFHLSGGTFALLKSFLPEKCGITTTFVDIRDLRAVNAAMRPNTKVAFMVSQRSSIDLVHVDCPSAVPWWCSMHGMMVLNARQRC